MNVPVAKVMQCTNTFNQRMLLQLQAMGTGQGEVPTIVLRSGNASQDFINRSQPVAAYFVGLAYLKGFTISKHAAASVLWFERAAKKGHSPGQVRLARALRSGLGTDTNLLAANAWLTAAAKIGNAVARTELAALEKIMNPQELEQAKGQPLPQPGSV